MRRKKKVFLGAFLNYINAQNLNCLALAKYLDKEKFEVYALIFPSGNLISKNGGYFNIKSEKGAFDQSNEKAHLFDNVVLNDQDGYVFKTESIFINLNSEKVYSNEKISGSGERGNIFAQGFEIIDNGNEVRFLGKTKLVILNK